MCYVLSFYDTLRVMYGAQKKTAATISGAPLSTTIRSGAAAEYTMHAPVRIFIGMLGSPFDGILGGLF